jgi:hypothetical protein
VPITERSDGPLLAYEISAALKTQLMYLHGLVSGASSQVPHKVEADGGPVFQRFDHGSSKRRFFNGLTER